MTIDRFTYRWIWLSFYQDTELPLGPSRLFGEDRSIYRLAAHRIGRSPSQRAIPDLYVSLSLSANKDSEQGSFITWDLPSITETVHYPLSCASKFGEAEGLVEESCFLKSTSPLF